MSFVLATFNVNGIRARLGIVQDWLEEQKPDALALQETKCQDKDFPAAAFTEAGYHASFHGQKSYNGVAWLTREEPDEVRIGLDDERFSDQARVISIRLGDLWLINTYCPQGREVDDPAFGYKLDFFARLHAWLGESFTPKDRLLWTGDINIAPQDQDVFDPKRMEGKVTCHPDERAALAKIVDWGLVELFRQHHPEEKAYTFWDYRLPQSFKRNLGWRIDHIYATQALAQASQDCWVDTAPRGLAKPSDHTPLLARLEP